MEGRHQVVHIGPISLFTLVASLGMAVLAVLAFSTANAMYVLSDRSATTTAQVYEAEALAQAFVGELDATLAEAREAGLPAAGYAAERIDAVAAAALRADDPLGLAEPGQEPAIAATVADDVVEASVTTAAARRVDLRIRIGEDGAYAIEQWKATSEVDSSGTKDTLWSPEG